MTSSVGKPIDRVDARAKVTGSAIYSGDHRPDALAYAVLVESTIGRGRIKTLETQAAERASGVLAVLTHRSGPRTHCADRFDPAMNESKSDVHILATDTIYWNGQPIAVVVADTLERAQYAASLVQATYEAEPVRLSLSQEKDRAFTPDDILGEKPEVIKGDAEAALRIAEIQVDHVYTTQRENHNAIEPHATVAAWDGDHLTVHDASQFVYGVRKVLAEKFAIPEGNVRVISRFVGGGFGGKGVAWPHVALAALAAKAVGRPVQLVLDRAHIYGTVGGRPNTEQRVALGARRDGKLTALIHTGITTTSTQNTFNEQISFPPRHLYACSDLKIGQKLLRLDIVPATFMRAPGDAPGTFALESAMDELSYALNMDPIDLRLANDTDKDPADDRPFSSRHFKEMFALGAEKFGWQRRTPKPRSMRDGRWLIGQGVATAFYPVYQFPAEAKVRVFADGTAVVQSAAHEMGMGTATVQAQVAADLLGLPMKQVRFDYGDTDLPFASVAGGSSTTVSVAGAVEKACVALKAKLLELVHKDRESPLCGAKADEIETRDAGLYRKDSHSIGETYADILARHGQQSVEAEAKAKSGEAQEKFSMASFGAQICEVRVDPDFGEVRVTRFVGVFDCGRILNAKTARSQFIGGITMGIGMALMEETVLDHRTAKVTNPNLSGYLVPVHADIPALEAYFLDKPDPRTPLGAHGIGEIGITGTAAAVANAVYHATGKRVRDLPILAEKLL